MKDCSICLSPMSPKFVAKVLKKYDVGYHQCKQCGLIQTDEPYWLEEAYSDAICRADTGVAMRNYLTASKLSVFLYRNFERDAAFLDVAGGYGLLTRLMRDYGFDYYWEDIYCENLVARGFEKDKSSAPFAAMTAIEVMEHLPDPKTFVEEIFSQNKCRTLIFTTELYKEDDCPDLNWWYYTFNTGQHIAFYKAETFQTLAKTLNLNFYSVNGLHILTDQSLKISPFLRSTTGRLSMLLSPLVRWKQGSLTVKDQMQMLGSHDNKAK